MICAFYSLPMTLRIRELRKARGLSQEQLASKAGLSRSQLSEIETEAKPANTLRLTSIASALGVTVEHLFSEDARTGLVSELMALMDALPEADREAILRHAKALADRR